MRVNDMIIRFVTVRVDEERKTADKLRTKREGACDEACIIPQRTGRDHRGSTG